MEFVNPWMLLGISAIAVPILIHLLNRKSARKVEWGAYRFLLDAMTSRKSRVLIEEILLLATRCLLLALLALAVARPFIQAGSRVPWVIVLPMLLISVTLFGVSFAVWRYPVWRRRLVGGAIVLAVLAGGAVLLERQLNLSRFGGGAERDVVLILDGSSSMTMLQGDKSNFEVAVAEAEDYIKNASRGTAFGVIIGGPVPQVLTPTPLTDRRDLYALLDTAKPLQGTMEITPTLTAAAITLASGGNPVKQIVIIGDGQAQGWHAENSEYWRVISSVLSQLKPKPQIVFRTLPLPASLRNVAIENVALSRSVVGTDREVGIRVTVANTGTEAVTPEEVRIVVEGKTLSNRSMGQLDVGATHTVTFLHKFDQPGAQRVLAQVVAGDDLPADDQATHIVKVTDALRVLIAEGNPSARGFERSSAYLELALRPEAVQKAAAEKQPGRKAEEQEKSFLVDPEIIDASALARRTSFVDCSVVVLADVPFLPPDTAKRLAQFVANGGGLLVTAGLRTQMDFFNTWTYQGEPLLPLPLIAFDGTVQSSGSTNKPSALQLAPETFLHDALKNLRTGSDLGQASVSRRWRMDEGADAGRVAGRFNDGSPFLAMRQLGRGMVAVFAMPFDATLSTIASRMSFLPMVHDVTYYLASPAITELNLVPREGVSILLSPAGVTAQSESTAQGLQGFYYTQPKFKGRMTPILDPTVDFRLQTFPYERIGMKWAKTSKPINRFCMRWTGALRPRKSGNYDIWMDSGAKAQVWINGQIRRNVYLREGETYDIRAEFEKTEDPETHVRLMWRAPDSGEQVIPKEFLLPYRATQLKDSPLGEETDIQAPDGSVFRGHIAQTRDGITLRITRSMTPGVYSVRVPGFFLDALMPVLDANQEISLSVKAGITESDMAVLSPDAMDSIRKYADLLTATKAEEVQKAIAGQNFGKEIWRTLAGFALLLFILEIALTRWIAIQRRTGETEQVGFDDKNAAAAAAFDKQLEAMRS